LNQLQFRNIYFHGSHGVVSFLSIELGIVN